MHPGNSGKYFRLLAHMRPPTSPCICLLQESHQKDLERLSQAVEDGKKKLAEAKSAFEKWVHPN